MLAKQLSDNLAACGQAITPANLQQYILNGLDSAYDAIVTTLTAANVDITLKDFQAHLLSFEMRLVQSLLSEIGYHPPTSSIL